MILRAKSTYNDIRARVEQDIARLVDVTQITPTEYISWILRAQEIICQRESVRDEYNLHYLENVIDYYLGDRPAITGITTATPPVVTAAAHGLAEGDLINITGIQGIDIPDGRYTAFNITTDTFDLYTFDSVVGDQTAIVGSGTYTVGGRLWLANEIPTYFDTLLDGQINTTAFIGTVSIRPIDDINEMMNKGSGPYPLSQWPAYYGMSRATGVKYVRVWAPPSQNGDLVLAGTLQVTPKYFMKDTIDTEIILSSEYDDTIEFYLKARLYGIRGKLDEMKMYDEMFTGAIAEKLSRDGPVIKKITYR